MKLITTWIEAEKRLYGHSQAQAIRELNEALEMNVQQSRVSEWKRGVYTPSAGVIFYALDRALPWILRSAGVKTTREQYAAVEEQIWVIDE